MDTLSIVVGVLGGSGATVMLFSMAPISKRHAAGTVMGLIMIVAAACITQIPRQPNKSWHESILEKGSDAWKKLRKPW